MNLRYSLLAFDRDDVVQVPLVKHHLEEALHKGPLLCELYDSVSIVLDREHNGEILSTEIVQTFP